MLEYEKGFVTMKSCCPTFLSPKSNLLQGGLLGRGLTACMKMEKEFQNVYGI